MESVLVDTVNHITHLLTASLDPLSFVFVTPGWDDSEFYACTTKSPFLTGRLDQGRNMHFYKYGMQHRLLKQKRYRKSECSTFFFLQNEAGASGWPVTQRKLNVLREAFSIKQLYRYGNVPY